MRRISPLGCVLGLALASCGCDRSERSAPNERPPVARPGAASTSAAFDLVTVDGGAVLLWAPSSKKGSLAMLRLDGSGAPRGDERQLFEVAASGEVYEVAATSVAPKVAVAWVAAAGPGTKTWGALVDIHSAVPPAPRMLGEGDARSSRVRGWLAMASDAAGKIRVLHRGKRETCAGGEASCAGFGFSEIVARGDEPGRPWLEVRQPCRFGAVGFAVRNDHWYYSVCAVEGDRDKTTLFSIHFDPEYARADEVFVGCTPIGLPNVDGHVWLVADCGDERRAVRSAFDDTPPVDVADFEPKLTCVDGAPAIRVGDVDAALTSATDRLEALLPASIAPIGARAVYTGSVLLVAQRTPKELELRRYACSGDSVVRTDVPEGVSSAPE